jgi:hypothetical protein
LITFQRTGGTYNGVTFEIDDDPLFHAGDDVVLFFVEYEPGQYRVSGGPTGRFEVVDQGREVRSTVVDGVKLPAGTSLDAFAQL